MNDIESAIKELEVGNYSEGMVILQNLLKDDPENVIILFNLGMCYSEMGLINKSIEILEKCLRIESDFTNAMVALGFSYYKDGSDDKAMNILLKALEIEPDNFYALKNIGPLFVKKGEPDRAITSFKKADTLIPNIPEVLLGLGQAYEIKNQFDEASYFYKKVKNMDTTALIVDKANEGLNRIAMAQLKSEGKQFRPDVIMYCLSAIELFSKLSSEKVREISFEIAMLGTTGLSINDPENKYTLKSMHGKFSGLQLLCYMFVGFKIIDGKLPPVADMETEYQQALKLYRSRLNEH